MKKEVARAIKKYASVIGLQGEDWNKYVRGMKRAYRKVGWNQRAEWKAALRGN